MPSRAWVASGAVLVLLLAGCGGETTGPSTGSLAVTVTGLPPGVPADLAVSGPDGFARSLDGSQLLTGLAPGTYTVSASGVTVGAAQYAAAPATQTVTVAEGTGSVPAQVAYQLSSGNLAVTIAGLPPGTAAAVSVTGPGGFTRTLTASATIEALNPGTYTVAAEPVSAGGTQYAGSPATQQAAVASGGTAGAAVTYADNGPAGLNFKIDGVYLTQSVQSYAGAVPLVADRDAYLRVFVTASEANALSPAVRVRFYHAGSLVSEETITRVGSTPLVPQEGTLSSSWNLPVPKALIQPNLSLRVEVDPAGLIAETNESDNAFPASGLPLVPEVRTASQFQVTLVPVLTSVDGRTGNVAEGNKHQFFTTTMRMHPLSSYDALVGATLTVDDDVPALQSGNENTAWNQVLSEVEARRTADGSLRYYLGVVNPPYSGGIAGIGYVGYPVALAWDKPGSAASVAAHEWGHNWGRNHAPCGGAGNPDQGFPYAGGTIGMYGFDVAALALKSPSAHDLMGYCNDEWISDYTYTGVMNFRSAEPRIAGTMGQAVQSTLVVWGRIENGTMILEPAFQTVTRPRLPERDGPYSLEARAPDGSRVFALSFAPVEVADDRRGAAHFSFAVPLAPERAARVATLRLSGRGRSAHLARGADRPAAVEVTRAAPGRVALRWDASRTPMVVVRDPRTGQVLAFARGGRAEVATDQAELGLTLSNRLQSRDLRVRVPAR